MILHFTSLSLSVLMATIQVESALGSARGFVVYAKWKILRRLRVVLARVCLR
jgi:hypothetical protein